MSKIRRWRKDFPYYKIQVFNEIIKSWKDEREVFDTIGAARDHIEKKVTPRSARIIVVEPNARHVLDS